MVGRERREAEGDESQGGWKSTAVDELAVVAIEGQHDASFLVGTVQDISVAGARP